MAALGAKIESCRGLPSRNGGRFSNLTQFLLGNPRQLSILAPNAASTDRNYRWYTFGFYLQDDWRATARLNLNIGLRYEFNTTINETSGHGSSLPDMNRGPEFNVQPPPYKSSSL